MIKKVVSSVLSFALVLSLAPVQAIANEDSAEIAGGGAPQAEISASVIEEVASEVSSNEDEPKSTAGVSANDAKKKVEKQELPTKNEVYNPTETAVEEATKVAVTVKGTVATVAVSKSSATNLKEALNTITDITKITAIILPKEEIVAPADISHLFSRAGTSKRFSALTQIQNLSQLNTSNVTNMGYMFSGCSSLTSLDLSNFDTSNVTNMSTMLLSCSGLTSLVLSYFDTSNVTNMSAMLMSCSGLTSLDLSNFDMSNVIYMSDMFRVCSSLTSLDLSNFDTSKVIDMSNMFRGCLSLASIDLSGFDTANVAHMSAMFAYCSGLTSLDLSNFDTSNVTHMIGMFGQCSGLTGLDLSNFDTSNVTHMNNLFGGCSSLASIDLSSFDTSNVTTMSQMFSDCSSLMSLDLSNFDTSNVTNMGSEKSWEQGMFAGCSSLKSLDLSNFDTSNVEYFEGVFEGVALLDKVKTSAKITENITSQIKASKVAPGTGKWYLAGSSAALDKITAKTAGTWYAYQTVIVEFNSNGGSAVSPIAVEKGSKITEPQMPKKAGYVFSGWYSDSKLANKFYFAKTAINTNITLYAKWIKYVNKFSDVNPASKDDWFASDVQYMVENQFMTGYGGTDLFAPYDTTTRSMMITVLWRTHGKPAVKNPEAVLKNFPDKGKLEEWSKEAWAWAVSAGVTTGFERNGAFYLDPQVEVVREQIATFIWRDANKPKATNVANYNALKDHGTESGFATEAMKWISQEKIITGNKGYILPYNNASRSELAAMVARYDKK